MSSEEIPLSASVTFVPDKSSLITMEHGDIHLTPNERRLLELIISGKCKKETIFEEIWLNHGMIVSESSYHQLIKMLRRKLQHAGLPGSIIKTIPRYGVVLAPGETPENERASTVVSEQDNCMPSPPEQECCPPLPLPAGSTELPVAPTAQRETTPRKGLVSLVAMCCLFIVLPPLLVTWVTSLPQAFPKSIQVDNVTFHLSSLRSVDRQALAHKRHALPKGITNVYIASNGPKVFIAQCEGELVKEGRCSYEYYSSY